jgi:hypothetical protein
LVSLARENPELGRVLAEFADITVRSEKETGEVVDIFGNKNVSIAKTEEGYKLLMLDPHVTFSTQPNGRGEYRDAKQGLAFLQKLSEEIKKDYSELKAA